MAELFRKMLVRFGTRLTDGTNRRIPQSMPKKKDPPLPPNEQFKRFLERAREYEVDESGKAFERAFKKAVPPKKRRRNQTSPKGVLRHLPHLAAL